MTLNYTLIILVCALITLIMLLRTTLNNTKGNKIYKAFSILILMFVIHISGLILQILFSKTSISPVYFEYIAYIGGMNFSTAIFIMALTYLDENRDLKKFIYNSNNTSYNSLDKWFTPFVLY